MKFERNKWTPLTVTFENQGEAEVLYKILERVDDMTHERWTYGLFMRLGENLGADDNFTVSGEIEIRET